MYRIFPVKALIYAAALLAVGVFLAIELVTSAFDIEVRRLAIPSLVWALCVALTLNPIWRWVWSVSKRFSWLPDLGYHLFPDLNGEWEMTLRSNWSRQMQLLDAAADRRRSFDPRTCEAGELAELLEVSLVAEIEQSWWSIKITVTNPLADTPIKRSTSFIVMPRKRSETQRPSLCYFYNQKNDTDNQADDLSFDAAACMFYDNEKDQLEGTFWTARQWRRAINTAGTLTLNRLTNQTA
jgi:hypothetical protein|tara:strand:+ start:336 stop:1052 length:717 start_codon:yes stop_codon:yes gene_type:complete